MAELLAPAGNLSALKIAIRNGADAVYLGLSSFSARGKIQNFSLEEFKEGVDFAHLYGAKVYVAINTLLKNDELQNALDLVREANNLGADAFIVQDLGFAKLIKENYESVILHASTQMGIHNYQGALMAKEMGISRVILSREAGIDDIKEIKEKTGLEIEYFIQGALCVCFSGNCYMSAMLGESGNRGKCLQLCRLPYKMFVGDKEKADGYLLSAKDICLGKRLEELILAGVDSFKIEGRARREGYVAQAISTYRKALDTKSFNDSDLKALKVAFNRGDYAEAYLNGNGSIIDFKVQGHKGVRIGKVVSFDKGNRFNVVTISSNYELSKGDAVKFFKNGFETGSMGIADIKKSGDKYLITTTQIISVGDEVHIIVDASEEEKAVSKERKLPFDASFVAFENGLAKLTLRHGKIEACVTGECYEAQKAPISQDMIRECLNKSGEEFSLNKLNVKLGNVFMPKSALNEMRRTALIELRDNIIASNFKNELLEAKEMSHKEEKQQVSNKLIVETDDLNEIEDSVAKRAEAIVLRVADFEDLSYIDNYIYNNKVYINIIANLSSRELELLKDKLGNRKVCVNNLGAYMTFRENSKILGIGMNIYNKLSLSGLEYDYYIISPELSSLEASELESEKGFSFAYGCFAQMTLKHCPIKNVLAGNCKQCSYNKDIVYSGNKDFRLLRTKVEDCHFTLYNEKPIDRLSEYAGKNKFVSFLKVDNNLLKTLI